MYSVPPFNFFFSLPPPFECKQHSSEDTKSERRQAQENAATPKHTHRREHNTTQQHYWIHEVFVCVELPFYIVDGASETERKKNKSTSAQLLLWLFWFFVVCVLLNQQSWLLTLPQLFSTLSSSFIFESVTANTIPGDSFFLCAPSRGVKCLQPQSLFHTSDDENRSLLWVQTRSGEEERKSRKSFAYFCSCRFSFFLSFLVPSPDFWMFEVCFFLGVNFCFSISVSYFTSSSTK